MDTSILVALISTATSLAVAAFTFWLTKKREREAEWRKQKLEHYRELIESLSGIVEGHTSQENRLRWARACNTITLVAPSTVIIALQQFLDATADSRPFNQKDHDNALNQLIFAIRADIGVFPKDDTTQLNFRLWSAGKHSNHQ